MDWLIDWLSDYWSSIWRIDAAMGIWSGNLQHPYTSKLEVIWDQTTSNFIVYNLHPRYKHTAL